MRIIVFLIMLFGVANSVSQQKSWLAAAGGSEVAKSKSNRLDDRCGCNNSDLCCVSCTVQIFTPAATIATALISGFLTPICCPSCGLITAAGIPCMVGSCAMASVCHCIYQKSRRMYPDEVRVGGMTKDPYEYL